MALRRGSSDSKDHHSKDNDFGLIGYDERGIAESLRIMLSGKKSTLWFWSNARLCDFGSNASSGVRAKTKRQLLAFVYV